MWLVFKILSDFISAANINLTKALLEHRDRRPELHFFAIGIIATVPFLYSGYLYLLQIESLTVLANIVVYGAGFTVAAFFYYKALATGSPTQLSLIFRLVPVMQLIFSAVLLSEILEINQYLAFLPSLLASYLLIHKDLRRYRTVERSTRYMLVCVTALSLSQTALVPILSACSPWETLCLTKLSLCVCTMLMLSSQGMWRTCAAFFKLPPKTALGLLSEQLLRLLAQVLSLNAIAVIQSVTLVSLISGFSPLYVFSIAVITGQERLLPGEIKEKLVIFLLLLLTLLLLKLDVFI